MLLGLSDLFGDVMKKSSLARPTDDTKYQFKTSLFHLLAISTDCGKRNFLGEGRLLSNLEYNTVAPSSRKLNSQNVAADLIALRSDVAGVVVGSKEGGAPPTVWTNGLSSA